MAFQGSYMAKQDLRWRTTGLRGLSKTRDLGITLATCLTISACQPAKAPEKASTPAKPAETAKAEIAAEVAPPAVSSYPDPAVPGLPAEASTPEAKQLRQQLAAALKAKGPNYKPRTEHLHPEGSPEFTNRLILESSPYLLQHAHNPVNWNAWGEAAFARAKAENKPVLLSVGYSTCHWCHVMERESFENKDIASFINQNYIPIKVDREERPDVDDVYMAAVQKLTGRGGWPMTVIMTPDAQPFFGGTYFPPFDGVRGSRTGFMTILKRFARDFQDSPSQLFEQAAELSQKLQASNQITREGMPTAQALARADMILGRRHDTRWGGFGAAPKFPRPSTLDFLLRWQRRTNDNEALASVRLTLDRMIEGGIHDHVGGGFHRYSTDARWLVPHFEKMLYDNGQLVVTLIDLHQVTGDQKYADVARETLDYLIREMSDVTGAFYSATDADSPVPEKPEHREEGLFFTWTPEELEETLGARDAQRYAAYFGVKAGGNFEGRSILHTRKTVEEVAKELGAKPEVLRAELVASSKRLYSARSKRLPPLLDDKVLASWNGLVLSALARAGFVLGEAKYLERAQKLAEWLSKGMRDGQGRLIRSARHRKLGGRAYLDDYAFVIQGLLDLFEADFNDRWLTRALDLQAQLDQHFGDEVEGGYFTTSDDAERLLVRQKPSYDGAEPSGNSVALLNLLRLHAWTEKPEFKSRGMRGLELFSRTLARNPTSVPKMLCALDFALDSPRQVFIVVPDGELNAKQQKRLDDLRSTFRASFLPNRISLEVKDADVEAKAKLVPALAGKKALKRMPTAFVCEQGVCQLPTSKGKTFAKQLAMTTPYVGL